MKNGLVSSHRNQVSFLKERFLAIFDSGDNSSELEAFFEEVRRHYEDPSRHHHNIQHILEILQYVDARKNKIQNWEAIQLAIFLHDVIYDVHEINPGVNEDNSWSYTQPKLVFFGIQQDIIHRVGLHIGDTKTHTPSPELGSDGEYFLDGDLSVLGASQERYRKYQNAIKEEFSWVPDDEYNLGRTRIMGNFLEREKIFFRDSALETIARENIINELESLR